MRLCGTHCNSVGANRKHSIPNYEDRESSETICEASLYTYFWNYLIAHGTGAFPKGFISSRMLEETQVLFHYHAAYLSKTTSCLSL